MKRPTYDDRLAETEGRVAKARAAVQRQTKRVQAHKRRPMNANDAEALLTILRQNLHASEDELRAIRAERDREQ